MATANRYSLPEPGGIGLDLNENTDQLAKAIESDAATNGLSAWGLSVLQRLGRPVKPEWLKESSKEWFNKPLPDPRLPSKDEFTRIVEPLAHTSTGGENQFATDLGLNSLRAKYGLPVSSIFKGREDIISRDRAPLTGTPEEQRQKYNEARAAFEKDNPMPPMGTPLGEYGQKWRTFLDNWQTQSGTPAQATTGIAVGEPSPSVIPATPASTPGIPSTAANTFLPPYLQPGGTATTSGQPPSPFNPVTPPSPFGTPPLPAVNQMAPIVPLGIAPQGSPFTPFVPNAPMANRGMGGGNSFESTAKLLQLPFYLRSLYGR